jgi:polyribonucleotide nucleotidyltransferase
MDFKVGGTHDGITAIQMDLKIDGLTPEIIKEAIETTHAARIKILDESMLKAIDKPRAEVNEYAPKMLGTKVPVDKIREIIGTGGKVIQKLAADFECKIDVDDEGNVFVCGMIGEKAKACIEMINAIVAEPEIGAIYKGKVVRVADFGAFVEFAPGKDGLVHISELENRRVEKVSDVCKEGDEMFVKIVKIDKAAGKIGLSRKEALADIERKKNA